MATFIPQIQDEAPELKLFSPDFEMMNNWLTTKQTKYNQASLELGSIYAQLKALPLTADENIATRDQFIKDAEIQVKKLAEVDLSLPENYRAARGIFTPLLENEDIMTDLSFTLKANAMVKANQAFKNSSVEEDRKRYNPNNDAFVSLKLNEFKMGDSATRKAMAGQNFSFVNNVNLFQKYLDATKGMDYDIVYESAPTYKGTMLPYMIKQKNGKEITPQAYNRLSRLFNTDPDVQAYYNQKGYITVQSELQELIPTVGYDAAVQAVSQKYNNSESIKKAQESKTALETEIKAAEETKRAYESKATKVGIIPGSKEHMAYLQANADLGLAKEEYKAVIEENRNLALVATNLNDLYQSASNYMYNNDLSVAADDYAMRSSSLTYEATPNYKAYVEARSSETKIDSEVGGSLLSDTAPITYTPAEGDTTPVSVKNNEILSAKQKKLNSDFVGVLSQFAIEYNTANPDKQNEIKIPGTSIKDATSAAAWYERISGTELKGQELQNAIEYLSKLDESGDLDKLYPETALAFQNWQDATSAYIKAEEINAASYKNAVVSYRDRLSSNPNTAIYAPIIDRMYAETTGVITNFDDFEKKIIREAREGKLPKQLSDVLLTKAPIKPSGADVSRTAQNLAEQNYLGSLPQDQRIVSVKDNEGNVVGNQTAWEALTDNKRADLTNEYMSAYRIWERNPQLRNSEEDVFVIGRQIAATAAESVSIKNILKNIHSEALRTIDQYYEADPNSQSVVKLLNPGAVPMGGAVDALEYVSNNIDVKPRGEHSSSQRFDDQQVLLANINKGLQSGDITIRSTPFTPEVIEDYADGKTKGEDNEGRQSYALWSAFYESMKTQNDAKSSTSSSSPRATLKVLPGIPIEGKQGRQNVTAIEITYNTGFLNSVTSTAEDPGMKVSANLNLKKATIFIPEQIAAGMNIPVSQDVEAFTNLTINQQSTLKIGGSVANLNYNPEKNIITYTTKERRFDPKTGSYKTVSHKGTTAFDGNAVDYSYLRRTLTQELNALRDANEQLEADYNSQNGAVYSTDDL